MLIIGASRTGETSTLLNLIKEQNDIDKMYFYAKDFSKTKYECLIKKRENAGTKHLKDPKAFIECFSTMDVFYLNIDDCNPSRKRKNLIVFDEIIAGIMSNKTVQVIIKELFIRCRKLNISLVFITQSYFLFQKISD